MWPQRFIARYENLSFMEYLHAFMLTFFIFFTLHILCCIWYYIGTSDEEVPMINGSTLVIKGWVNTELESSFDSRLVQGVSFRDRYALAMYYVMHVPSFAPGGTTRSERDFAIVNFVFMLLLEGAVAGVLSATIIGMSAKQAEISAKLKAVRQWMYSQHIPKQKAKYAIEYFRQVYKSKVVYEENSILKSMPCD